MTRFAAFGAFGLAVLLTFAVDAAAQFPPATPEQRAAGARVAEIRFGIEELVVPRDEIVTLETTLVDAEGNPVEGAIAVIFVQAGVSPTFSTVSGPTIELTGQQPGSGALMAVVMGPESAGRGMFGVAGARQLGTLPVTVLDYPVASIEIDDLSYAAYTGTSLRMTGTVLTDRGTEHVTASISWRSSNPSVAAVTGSGVLTGLSEGMVTVSALTENGITADATISVLENPVRSIVMTPGTASTRTGDVVEFDIVARDAEGRVVGDIALDLAVSGLEGTGGFVFDDGTFVAEETGCRRPVFESRGRRQRLCR